jgi:hypothetical protein
LFKKYNVLVGMFIAQMIIAFSLQHAGNRFVECKHEGHIGAGWGVNSMVGVLVFMSHVMPAMFCCAMPRYVFIKDVEGGFLDQLTADMTGEVVYEEDDKFNDSEGTILTDFSKKDSLVANDFVKAEPLASGSIIRSMVELPSRTNSMISRSTIEK